MTQVSWAIERIELARIKSPGLGLRLNPVQGWSEAIVVRIRPEDAPADFEKVLLLDWGGETRYFLAFLNVCTHMGCRLVYAVKGARPVQLVPISETGATCGPCHCHGTTFDLTKDGLVVLGPATQNLPVLQPRPTSESGDRFAFTMPEGIPNPETETWPAMT